MTTLHPRRAVSLLALCTVWAALACGGGPRASSSGSPRPAPTPTGVPIGSPTSARIGAAGGELSTPDGLITVTVPPGALAEAHDFTIQEIVNYAPNAVGGAYRLGPEGTTFSTPVSVTFRAELASQDLDDLAVAYQDVSGYWVRPARIVRDRTAGTLTVPTTHFSDWTLVTTPSGRDLSGTFTLTQTVALPFSATGSATLSYAGENAYENFYLLPGTVTAPSQIPYGSSTCSPSGAADATLPVQLAEMIKSPAQLLWAINAYWTLSCTGPSGASTNIISTQFDTAGINLIGCARHYDGTPVVGPARAAGSYTIDCGTQGSVHATWDFKSSVCGQPCTPANACDTGTWSCDTGTAVCVDTGTPVANGTSCGTDQVCNAGVCVACTANAACTPANACDAGLTSCSTGTQVCVDTGTALANGTTCGTNQVCNAGACVACTANAACTPTNVCDTGLTSCSTGTQTCVDTGIAVADGNSCGTDQVCYAGTCTACTAGVACTPANVCDTGVTSCSTGIQVCLDTGTAVANGTSCGTNQVCNAGTCTACTAGLACTPANPCDTGVTSCSTGAQTCVDTGTAVANGTACGAGLTCNAGGCVASATVTGTRTATYWPDAGATLPVAAPDVGVATVEALVPGGAGGWITYPGAFAADGSFTIPNVPTGSYVLVFRGLDGVWRDVVTTATAVDLGYDVLGRAGAADPTASTPVTLSLSGLDPWSLGDEVQVVSSNADVWDSLPMASVGAGAVSADSVEDWYASAVGGPLHLLATGDPLTIFQLHTTPASGGLPSYLSATAVATPLGVTLTSGTASTIPAALAPPASTGAVTVDWNVAGFEALLPAMGPPGTTASRDTFVVGASAQPLSLPAPAPRADRHPTLFRIEVPGGSGQTSITFGTAPTYGHVLDAIWSEWREVAFEATASFLAPGATTPFTAVASAGRREPMSALPAGTVAPTLSPVQSPLVGGVALSSLSTPAAVGSAPVVSWTAPSTGAPTHYTVEVFQLSASGSASVATLVAVVTTGATQVQLPPGLLAAGSTYYARITASGLPSDPFATRPERSGATGDWASTLTGTFTP
ncbi:hypothetical protein [Anaeromyxobacter oryzisoli]|uniref:hypothetical protein n=1 Tax=Anaeromyxobacter oryzisoli TaxID=2925408 RepID=UPI001F573A02|nr:hypothetical protein [Anaeromyxobacter sp. SG63]